MSVMKHLNYNKIIYFQKAMKSTSYFKIDKNNDDIIMTPTEGYDSVLIWLHGLGDSALGYKDVFTPEYRPIPNRMKVILLTAPKAAVTMNGGMVMTSWYDIKSLDKTKDNVEESDVHTNAYRVMKVIDNEVKSIDNKYQNVFVGGFSQGACMSMHIGMTAKYNLGGIICFSGVLFQFTELNEERKDLPILISHGKYDQLIPEPLALTTYKRLFDGKYNTKYASYEIDHTISMEELESMKEFIEKNLKI